MLHPRPSGPGIGGDPPGEIPPFAQNRRANRPRHLQASPVNARFRDAEGALWNAPRVADWTFMREY
jgi:hypothetical protein